MNIHALQTGKVKITRNWQVGRRPNALRLLFTLFDTRFTDWLPIFVWVIEHPEGLIVIDTGIPTDANAPIYFPPFMLLVQRAAPFDMSADQEIGPQMRSIGFDPEQVRWVILTHLHQDHEGGLHHFPKAEFIVSGVEWMAAQGLKGRFGGYLNQRWPAWFKPTLIDFDNAPFENFPESKVLTQAGDVVLVPTPGHSAGHLSVILKDGEGYIFFAGDASYTQELLIADTVDGVGPDPAAQHETHQRILEFAKFHTTVYLPTHKQDAERRLAAREPLRLT